MRRLFYARYVIACLIWLAAGGATEVHAEVPAGQPPAPEEVARLEFLNEKERAEGESAQKTATAAAALRRSLEAADLKTNDPREIKRIRDEEAEVDAAIAGKATAALARGSDPPQSQPAVKAWSTFEAQRVALLREAGASIGRAKATYTRALRRQAMALAHKDNARALQLSELADAIDKATGDGAASLLGSDAAAVDLLGGNDKPEAISGTWTPDGSGGLKAAGSSDGGARLQFGPVPAGEYDYTVRFIRSTDRPPTDTRLLCEYQKHRIAFTIGGLDRDQVICGFDNVAGRPYHGNASTGRLYPAPLAGGVMTATVHVRKNYIVGELNGQVVAQCATDYQQMSVAPELDVAAGRLGFNTTVADVDLLSAQASAPSADERRVEDGQPRTVDLLSLVDLNRDVVEGHWTLSPKGEWVCTPSRVHDLIRCAYRPPAEYDYTIDFTLDELAGTGDVCQVCSASGQSFIWFMAAFRNRVNGFEKLGPHMLGDSDNPAATHGTNMLAVGHEYVSTVQVRRTGITAILNGVRVAGYPTNALDLSTTSATNLGCSILGLRCWSGVHVHRLTVREIAGGGVGQIIRRLPATSVGRTELAPPPPGNGKSVGLTSLPWVEGVCGWKWISKNAKLNNDPLNMPLDAGTEYIYAAAPSSLIYEIPEGCVAFRGELADENKDTSFRCMVYIDGNEALVSGVQRGSDPPMPVSVPIPRGAKRIELLALPVGSRNGVGTLWIQPRFEMAADVTPGSAGTVSHGAQVSMSSPSRAPRFLQATNTGWRSAGDELLQVDVNGPHGIVFGDPAWTDFDMTVQLRRMSENTRGLVSLGIRWGSKDEQLEWVLGRWLWLGFPSSGRITRQMLASDRAPLEAKSWYTAVIHMREGHCACSLRDATGAVVQHLETTNRTIPSGQINLGTWFTSCQFRNLQVTAPDGRVLWTGFPTVPAATSDEAAQMDVPAAAHSEQRAR